MRLCASKDAGPQRGWIGGSHIDWRRERVPAMTLGPEGHGLGGLTSIGEENECQRGRWALNGVDWSVPHQLEKGTSVREDAGPEGG